jgi:Tfp pilus assembly protein FimT
MDLIEDIIKNINNATMLDTVTNPFKETLTVDSVITSQTVFSQDQEVVSKKYVDDMEIILQSVYDDSTGQILTDTDKPLVIQSQTLNNDQNQFEIKNGSDEVNFSVSASGNVDIGNDNKTGVLKFNDRDILLETIEPDLTNWIQRDSPILSIRSLRSVIWSPEKELYVAVGDDGGNSDRILISSDGRNWDRRSITSTSNWASITWGAARGTFIVVGAYAIAKSDSGINWSITTVTHNLECVCYSEDKDIFVAVGLTGILYNDSDSWIEATDVNGIINCRSVCYAPKLGIFVAVTNVGLKRVQISYNGRYWIDYIVPNGEWRSVCWSEERELFVAVGNTIMISSDGINWKDISITQAGWINVIYVSELQKFVAVTNVSLKNMMTSYNGIEWDYITLPILSRWSGTAYSPKLKQLVIVSTDAVIYSTVHKLTTSVSTNKNVFSDPSEYVNKQYVDNVSKLIKTSWPEIKFGGRLNIDETTYIIYDSHDIQVKFDHTEKQLMLKKGNTISDIGYSMMYIKTGISSPLCSCGKHSTNEWKFFNDTKDINFDAVNFGGNYTFIITPSTPLMSIRGTLFWYETGTAIYTIEISFS